MIELLILIVAMFTMSLLFPSGFKFFVGSLVGVAAGGTLWAVAAMIFPSLITFIAFGGCMFLGVVGGLTTTFVLRA